MDLPADREFGLFEAIVDLDDGFGLDKYGCSRARGVVNDALDPASKVSLHGQYVTVVADRVVSIRKMPADIGVSNVALKPLLEFVCKLNNFSSGSGQFWRGLIAHLTRWVDASLDLFFEFWVFLNRLRCFRETGGLFGVSAEKAGGLA